MIWSTSYLKTNIIFKLVDTLAVRENHFKFTRTHKCVLLHRPKLKEFLCKYYICTDFFWSVIPRTYNILITRKNMFVFSNCSFTVSLDSTHVVLIVLILIFNFYILIIFPVGRLGVFEFQAEFDHCTTNVLMSYSVFISNHHLINSL